MEMIVTLPVSKSLPWYAAYLALSNPLGGVIVLIGERVFREPIQALSSAKYRVGGTLDDPVVDFVSIWDKSMSTRAYDVEPQTDDVTGLVESGAK